MEAGLGRNIFAIVIVENDLMRGKDLQTLPFLETDDSIIKM